MEDYSYKRKGKAELDPKTVTFYFLKYCSCLTCEEKCVGVTM